VINTNFKKNICFLIIIALPGHDGGAYAITYEPNSQLLFSGGKRGEIGNFILTRK
jgi:hypothetical protein